MTDRFVTVPDSLEIPADVKVPSARLSDSTAAGRALLDAADAAAQRTALGLGTAATTPATDYATAAQGAKADAGDVAQITLTGNLALTIPEGHPAGQVYRCVITQTTGGHTVTYDGKPVAVDLAAGASTLVEVWPGGRIAYPPRTVVEYALAQYLAPGQAMPNDGASDARSLIQSGIADMWAKAKADPLGRMHVLKLPAGRFRIDSYLVGRIAADEDTSLRNVGIKGAGMHDTVILTYGDTSGFIFSAPGTAWDQPSLSHCYVGHFTVDMTNSTHPPTDTPAYKAMMTRGAHDCRFESITVINSPATAIGIDYPVRTTFANCHVVKTGAGAAAPIPNDYGVTSAAASVSGFGFSFGLSEHESCLLIDCTATDCYRSGFLFESAPQASATLREAAIRMVGCRSWKNKIGVTAAGVGAVDVSDCDIHDNLRAGIFSGCTELSITQSGINVTVRDNRIARNGVGLYSTGAKKDSYVTMVPVLGGHRITGNVFEENVGAGILAERFTTIEAGGLVIRDNDFRANGGGGVSIGRAESPLRDLSVVGNNFDGNTDAGLSVVAPMVGPRIDGNSFYNSTGAAQAIGLRLSTAEPVTTPSVSHNTFRRMTTPMVGVSRLDQTHITANRIIDAEADPAVAPRLYHAVLYGTTGNWPPAESGWSKVTIGSQSDWIRPAGEGAQFTAVQDYSYPYRDLGNTGVYMEARINPAPGQGVSQPIGVTLALQSGSTRTMIAAGVNDMLAGYTSPNYCVWSIAGGVFTLVWDSGIPAIESHAIALARKPGATMTDVVIDGVVRHSVDVPAVAPSQLAGLFSRWVAGGVRRITDVRAMLYPA